MKISTTASSVEALHQEGINVADVSLLQGVLQKIQETLRGFIRTHLSGDNANTSDTGSDEAHKQMKQEKELAEAALGKIQKREQDLFVLYRTKTENAEEARGAERIMERQVFEFRNRRTELRTTLEMAKVREERVKEEDMNFQRECAEAAHIIGKELIAQILKKESHAGLVDRSEQEAVKRKFIKDEQVKREDARRKIIEDKKAEREAEED